MHPIFGILSGQWSWLYLSQILFGPYLATEKKAIYRLFLSVIFSLVACNIFWWSIGKFMAIVPFFQFIGVLHLLIKNNFRSMEKKG